MSGGLHLEIRAGLGGPEARTWAETLLNMYLRYCERQGWTAEVTARRGPAPGLDSVTVRVDGEGAAERLACERGTHRLVCRSSFDPRRRQVAFAAVDVSPSGGHPADLRAQIRSYDLFPDERVTDARTGVETADVAAVLDGDLQAFIDAALAGGSTG